MTDMNRGFTEKFKNKCFKYAILGDSITATWCGSNDSSGGASDAAHGYPQLLHVLLKQRFGAGSDGCEIQFANRGFGGHSTLKSMARIDTEIVPFKYDLVGVALGTNDWNGQTPLDTFQEIYKQLVAKLLDETTADIFLISLGYFENWRPGHSIRETEYNNIIKNVAEEFGLPYVDVREAMLDYMKVNDASFEDITFAPDPVHPNDLGHKIWADAIFKALNEIK